MAEEKTPAKIENASTATPQEILAQLDSAYHFDQKNAFTVNAEDKQALISLIDTQAQEIERLRSELLMARARTQYLVDTMYKT